MEPTAQTPQRITLRPQQPKAKRLSGRLGIVVMVGGGALVFALMYGIMSHQQTPIGKRGVLDLDKRVTSARESAAQFKDKNSAEESSHSDTLEPPPLRFVPRRDGKRTRLNSRGGQATEVGENRVLRVPQTMVYPSRETASRPINGVPPGWDSPNSPAWSGTYGRGPTASDASVAALNHTQDHQREAMEAGTGTGGSAGGKIGGMPTAAMERSSETAAQANGPSLGGGTFTASNAARQPGALEEETSSQTGKIDFLNKARKAGGQNSFAQSTRMKALSPYEIQSGWDIPAVLEQEINSDLPGEVRALVRENVFDTASGQFLLIPQGSRLVGEYDSKIAYAQNALLTIWNRLIFPDGSSIDLEGMNSQDARGDSGLRGRVNHHYGRILGTAALSSAFSIAAVLAQTSRQQGVNTSYPGSGDVAASAAASEISRLGAAVTRRNLSVQPSIRIPVGTRFSVRVHRDLLFPEPYRAYAQTAPASPR
jgi:type IV secretory pathway VirB10-like protein